MIPQNNVRALLLSAALIACAAYSGCGAKLADPSDHHGGAVRRGQRV